MVLNMLSTVESIRGALEYLNLTGLPGTVCVHKENEILKIDDTIYKYPLIYMTGQKANKTDKMNRLVKRIIKFAWRP